MSTSRKKPVPAKKPATPRTAPTPAQPLGLEEIKALIALVGREPFQEFEFEAGEMRFRIRKDGPAPVMAAPQVVLSTPSLAQPLAVPSMPTMPVAPAAPETPADEPGIHYVTSPIVGTFYRAPNPTSAPYAQPGDFVKPGQTLCIVEAMKLMNEIESDIAGEVVKVLVENGQPVEYGERLFAVRIG
ncbi:MAG TPA: acetyl-CoA carboxylase biotin carboxyl carrier protein [Holophagaceae bacterium]